MNHIERNAIVGISYIQTMIVSLSKLTGSNLLDVNIDGILGKNTLGGLGNIVTVVTGKGYLPVWFGTYEVSYEKQIATIQKVYNEMLKLLPVSLRTSYPKMDIDGTWGSETLAGFKLLFGVYSTEIANKGITLEDKLITTKRRQSQTPVVSNQDLYVVDVDIIEPTEGKGLDKLLGFLDSVIPTPRKGNERALLCKNRFTDKILGVIIYTMPSRAEHRYSMDIVSSTILQQEDSDMIMKKLTDGMGMMAKMFDINLGTSLGKRK